MSGGAVAMLVSKRLPNTLRSLEEYRAGEYKEGFQKRSIEQATFRVKRLDHMGFKQACYIFDWCLGSFEKGIPGAGQVWERRLVI